MQMMNLSIREQKVSLRKEVANVIKGLSESEIAQQSSLLTRKALDLKEYQDAKSISIFLSMPRREVSTREIVVKSLENGKTVFIPYIYSDEKTKYKTMDMLQIRDLEDLNSLKPDAWGIPTLPKDSIESRRNALGGHGIRKDSHATQDSSKLDLIFVPAVAFDQSFRRLGHGKGFYDQYLETYQKSLQLDEKMPCLVGLALTEQLLPLGHDIPTSDNDWNVNLVITAGRQTRNVAS